jgi:hypothetical protein
VQHEQASRTALLIAASLVLLHHDAKYSRLVSKASADLCGYVLEKHSSQTRPFLNCSAELVSADREVDRAYHDPGNFAALRLTKEMYQRTGTLKPLLMGLPKSSYLAEASIRSVLNCSGSFQLRYFGRSIIRLHSVTKCAPVPKSELNECISSQLI